MMDIEYIKARAIVESARARAKARPIPLPAAVIKATFPERS